MNLFHVNEDCADSMDGEPAFHNALVQLVDMLLQRIKAGTTKRGQVMHEYILNMIVDIESYPEFENVSQDKSRSFRYGKRSFGLFSIGSRF